MMAVMMGKMKWVSLVSSVMITVSAIVMRATPAKKPEGTGGCGWGWAHKDYKAPKGNLSKRCAMKQTILFLFFGRCV